MKSLNLVPCVPHLLRPIIYRDEGRREDGRMSPAVVSYVAEIIRAKWPYQRIMEEGNVRKHVRDAVERQFSVKNEPKRIIKFNTTVSPLEKRERSRTRIQCLGGSIRAAVVSAQTAFPRHATLVSNSPNGLPWCPREGTFVWSHVRP